jgi:predicted restriction endonuclease
LLLKLYNGRCAMTDCDVEAALEAAHICPYRTGGESTYHPQNGLLLRADVHTLFDLRLIGITDDYRIFVDPALKQSIYAELHGAKCRVPSNPKCRPSKQTIRERNQSASN